MKAIRKLAVLGLIMASAVQLNARNMNTSLFEPVAAMSVSNVVAASFSNDLVMYYKNDIFTVSYLNNTGEKVKFVIQTMDGEKIYQNISKKGSIYHNRLLLSSLPSGSYLAMLYVGDKEYATRFVID